jgi:predicted phosphodiesterase
MNVAALYDVHGNVHALEAVLAEPDVAAADVVLIGGDLASGPFPAETIELARPLPHARFVRGNADELASPGLNPAADAARRWVERHLDEERIEWLATLPFSWSADDVLYVHANPVDVGSFVTPRTPETRVLELLARVEETTVVTGHVHVQFERHVDRFRWVGAGSVGFPYEEAPGAYWALVADGDVALRRTEYDVDAATAAMLASGHPRAGELAELRETGAAWFATAS